MKDLYRGDGGPLSSYDEGWNDGVEAAEKALRDEAAALIRRLAAALIEVAGPKREHYEGDDCWYSCHAHPDYCGIDKSGECTCGADEYNATLERHAEALRDVREEA